MNITIPNNKLIKKFARQMFKGHWMEAILIVIITNLIISVPIELVKMFAPDTYLIESLMQAYQLIMSGPLSLCTAFYFLRTFRNERVGLNSLVFGFEYFLKGLTLYIFVTLKILLWSCLFVIPGIFAAFRYSQAFLILADNPSKGVIECIEESKILIQPRYGRYFVFLLGYLGWAVLASVPFTALTLWLTNLNLFAQYSFEMFNEALMSVLDNPWYILTDIPQILLNTYFLMGSVCLYDILSGKLVFGDNNGSDE